MGGQGGTGEARGLVVQEAEGQTARSTTAGFCLRVQRSDFINVIFSTVAHKQRFNLRFIILQITGYFIEVILQNKRPTLVDLYIMKAMTPMEGVQTPKIKKEKRVLSSINLGQ